MCCDRFDNQLITEAIDITTIDQPIHQLGVQVVRMIDGLINRQTIYLNVNLKIHVQGELIKCEN